jgi:hypothetical protein
VRKKKLTNIKQKKTTKQMDDVEKRSVKIVIQKTEHDKLVKVTHATTDTLHSFENIKLHTECLLVLLVGLIALSVAQIHLHHSDKFSYFHGHHRAWLQSDLHAQIEHWHLHVSPSSLYDYGPNFGEIGERESDEKPNAAPPDKALSPKMHMGETSESLMEQSRILRNRYIADMDKSTYSTHNKEEFFDMVSNHSFTIYTSTAITLNMICVFSLLFRKCGATVERPNITCCRVLFYYTIISCTLNLVSLAIRFYLFVMYPGFLTTTNALICLLLIFCEFALIVDIKIIINNTQLLSAIAESCFTTQDLVEQIEDPDKQSSLNAPNQDLYQHVLENVIDSLCSSRDIKDSHDD